MILDALKRADRERRQQDLEVPSLDTNHGDRPSGARSRRRWLVWASFLGLVVVVAAGFVWLQAPWRPEPQSAGTQPQTPSPTQLNSDPDLSGARTREAQLEPEQTEANTQKAAIEALYQEQEQPRQDSDNKLTREEIASLYRQAVKDTPHETLSGQETGVTGRPENTDTPETSGALAASERQLSAVPAPVSDFPQTENQPGEDSTESPDNSRKPGLDALPYIHTLSRSLQRNIPSINYQEHHYRPGGGSWVRLNRERKRAGDRIGPDLLIKSIDREGLTLNYRGRSFRLRALNSWINM